VRTHLLYIGSPAINAGANPGGFENDQRGLGFPREVGVAADIGATEGAVARPVVQPVPALGPWISAALAPSGPDRPATTRRRPLRSSALPASIRRRGLSCVVSGVAPGGAVTDS
jgi:hypothetical protein